MLRAGQARGRARAAAARRRRPHARSTPTSSAPRSRRSPGASAASPCCGPRPARCSALAGHRVLGAPAARARRSRSSRSPPRWRPGKVKARASFPVQTEATLEGVKLQNAHGEACGGSLKSAFAESCNSVFAPLGAKVGARRLVETAERFGFNQDPGPVGAARSTIPAAGRDRRRPRGRLDGDRPGQGARHAARARDRRGDHRPARPRASRRRCSRGAQGKRDARRQRAHRARAIARFMRAVVTLGHRRRRRRPGRQGRGQDRHRGAAQHGQRRPAAARAGREPDAAARGGQDRHRRLVRRPSRPTRTRASRSPCCSSARARAARRPRRRAQDRASRPRSALDVEVDGADVARVRRAGDAELERAVLRATSVVSLKRISEPWIGPKPARRVGYRQRPPRAQLSTGW